MTCKYYDGMFKFYADKQTTYVHISEPTKLKLCTSLTVLMYDICDHDRIAHIDKFIDEFERGENCELGFMDTSGVRSLISSYSGEVCFRTNTGGDYWASRQYFSVPFEICKDAVVLFCKDCKGL